MKKLQFKKVNLKLNNEKWNLLHRTLFIIFILSCIDIVIIGIFVKDFREILSIFIIFNTHCFIAIISAVILYVDITRIDKINYDKKQSENKKV